MRASGFSRRAAADPCVPFIISRPSSSLPQRLTGCPRRGPGEGHLLYRTAADKCKPPQGPSLPAVGPTPGRMWAGARFPNPPQGTGRSVGHKHFRSHPCLPGYPERGHLT